MLRVKVERAGLGELEVREPHVGQRLTFRPAPEGEGDVRGVLEVHLWWSAADLVQGEAAVAKALLEAVPLVDELALVRGKPDGSAVEVFRGSVVETGTDGQQVFVSAEQVVTAG